MPALEPITDESTEAANRDRQSRIDDLFGGRRKNKGQKTDDQQPPSNTPPEDQQQKPEDQQPPATPPTPEDKKKAEEDKRANSARELRAQRDRLQAENEELQKELKRLRPLKPVADHLSKKKGNEELEDDDITSFIETNRARKRNLTEISAKLAEKDKVLQDLDITRSDMWVNGYQKEIENANTALSTTVADFEEKIGDDGKPFNAVIAPKSTGEFLRFLRSQDQSGNPPTVEQIKIALTKFKRQFKEESGVEYNGTLSEIVPSTQALHNKVRAAQIARSDWSKATEERAREQRLRQIEEEKRYVQVEIDSRNQEVVNALSSKDVKDLSYLDEDGFSVADHIRDTHEFMSAVLQKDPNTKPRGYASMITQLGKGAAFDHVASKLKEANAEIERLQAQLESSAPIGGGGRERRPQRAPEGGDKTQRGRPLARLLGE